MGRGIEISAFTMKGRGIDRRQVVQGAACYPAKGARRTRRDRTSETEDLTANLASRFLSLDESSKVSRLGVG